MRAGLVLIVAQIDEIGVELSSDVITSETAATNIASLEQIPVYFAASFFAPGEGCEA
jgi:hypothetical protein